FLILHHAPPAFYTLSLHDALPICFAASFDADTLYPVLERDIETVQSQMNVSVQRRAATRELLEKGRQGWSGAMAGTMNFEQNPLDRKSTRLNSSHSQISYAVFCLK